MFIITVDHFRSHPVGVSHHSVSLPAIVFLQAGHCTQGQHVFMRVLNHEPRQPEVCHHHRVVLHKGNNADGQSAWWDAVCFTQIIQVLTSCTRQLNEFRSLWMMFMECRYA